MAIKTIPFQAYQIFGGEDCIVLKSYEDFVTMAFPFHEDTPNFHLSMADAFSLRNALDEVIKQKLLTTPKGDL